MSCRIAQQRGVEHVIAIDLVPERLERARAHGVQVIDLEEHDDLPELVRAQTDGRGPDSVIDAVGMEAHGAPIGKVAQRMAGFLPDAVAQKVIETAGFDRLSALHLAIELVRRGGTISLSGVYGGAASPMPLIQMFDKQINMRMGQANVKRWIDDLMPLVTDDKDPAEPGELRHPPRADRRGAEDVRGVPEEAGQRVQGRDQALRRLRSGPSFG